MRKLLLFLGILAFVAEAHADPDDDIFTITNKSNRTICIRAVGEEKDEHSGSNSQWTLQSEVEAGQKRVFKRKELGDPFKDEGIKLIKITDLGIAIEGSARENEYIFKFSHSLKRSFVITDPFLQHLGLLK